MTPSKNARKSTSDESLPGDAKSPTPQRESRSTRSNKKAPVPGTAAGVKGQSDDPPKIPIPKGITTKLKKALAAGTEAELMVGILLDQGYAKVDEASFRVWVTRVVGMDEKQAYRLRAVGHVVRPLVENKEISLDYLLKVGMSRLTTFARFPTNLRLIQKSPERISVRADDEPEPVPIDEMTVAKLRDMLRALKGRDTVDLEAAKKFLRETAERTPNSQMCGDALASVRDQYIPIVETWHSRAVEEYRKAGKRKAAIFSQVKKADEQSLASYLEIRESELFLMILRGNYYDEIPGTAEAVTEALEGNADAERRKVSLAVAAVART